MNHTPLTTEARAAGRPAPSRSSSIAGPRGLPLLGNALAVVSDPLGFLTRVSREYGDVVRFTLPGQNIYLLNHPDAIEEALKASGEDLTKDDFTQRLSIAVGRGLLTSEGEFWRRQRKLAQPAFHHHRVRAYADVMVRHAERVVAGFSDGETLDIHDAMMRLTLDIVAETLFGADVGGAAERISTALETLMERFAGYGALVPNWVPTPQNRKIARALKDMDDVVYRIIGERRSAPDRGDLLSMLLAATTEEGGGMTDQQLRDEIVTLLLAGHETTALALTFTLHLLAKNPSVLEKLSAEVNRVLDGRPATFADLAKLQYADAVVRETLRLYPPAWAIGREAARPCRVAELHLEKGTQVWLAQWVVHRDARWFPEPDSFAPDRWLEDAAKRLPRYAYFPFGGGPRICIGNAFATMEAVLLLVTIVRRARLHRGSERPLALSPSVTLRPRGPVPMRVERLPAA
ncbi:MAG TPA: cytochrome P450 [Polyangiaceae bacterium]|jgi:cytochrome P450|nr:cytochrome P450 [Polyangiaceae bacterium]